MWSAAAFSRENAFSALADVWALAWPATLHLSLLTSVFVADRALVGRLDPGGLAALHGATTMSWTVASVLGAVAVGALATVGAHVGAGRVQQARDATTGALVFVGSLTTLVALAAWLARDALLTTLFPSLGPSAHRDAAAYLAVLLPALPVGMIATTAAACLHARRDTRTPLSAGLWAHGANLLVSACLVFGWGGLPRLGVVGAAIGTALSFVVQAAWLLPKLELGDVALTELWHVTRPVFGERIAHHGGYLVFAGMIGGLGPVAMAAHQGLLGVEAFGYTIAEGFGVAAAALVANHLGAGRPRAAQRAAAAAMGMATLALTAVALVILTLGPELTHWLCCDGDVGVGVRDALPIAALQQPFVAIALVGCAALRGAGKTRVALAATLAGVIAVRLPAAQLLMDVQGLRGAWMAAAVDSIVVTAVIVPLVSRLESR